MSVVGVVCVVLFGLYLADVHDDRKKHVILTGPTPVFSAEEDCFPKAQDKTATVAPGDPVSVRRVSYPKDCMMVRIRLKSGQEGFLVSGEGKWDLQ
ncbi:MAG: hypothetical protein M3O85_01675 [Acidobacteriota bacterium]|nr:hypothetical protein [Acidobacteriota bacterium]